MKWFFLVPIIIFALKSSGRLPLLKGLIALVGENDYIALSSCKVDSITVSLFVNRETGNDIYCKDLLFFFNWSKCIQVPFAENGKNIYKL